MNDFLQKIKIARDKLLVVGVVVDNEELLSIVLQGLAKEFAHLYLGMAIFAQLAGTRLSPTLMGRILPGLIKNRVGYGFKKKKNPKRVWVRFGFYQKNPRPDSKPGSDKNPVP